MSDEGKQIDNHEESALLTLKLTEAFLKIGFKETEHLNRQQAWLIIGRAINAAMAQHYGISMAKTVDALAAVQAEVDARPDETANE